MCSIYMITCILIICILLLICFLNPVFVTYIYIYLFIIRHYIPLCFVLRVWRWIDRIGGWNILPQVLRFQMGGQEVGIDPKELRLRRSQGWKMDNVGKVIASRHR